ncbi:MAG TPA: hypothetical protein VFA94_10175 [Acidimicrobiales bacterium]|nr:hypothetical protein [Acidimicrobiales bacterium]
MALVFTMLGVMQRPAQAAGWTISPTPLAFGQLRIGQVGIDRITITNNTGTSQTIHSVKTEGGTGPQDYFGITGLNSSFQGDPSQDCLFDSSHTPRTLADGESCSFFIIVSPTQVGDRSTSFVARDTANNMLWSEPLSATGTAGYYLAGAFGEVKNFGDAANYGDATKLNLNGPIIDAQQVPFGEGYWLLGTDGGVFSYGKDAKFYGSTGSLKLNAPAIAMAPLFDDDGYLFAAADGGVFSFGPHANAHFRGSMGGKHLNAPIVGIATLPSGTEDGYFLVAADGGVFAFGDAADHFKGSMGGKRLNSPIIGIVPMYDDDGYFLIAEDGGIFAFGSAADHFKGSMGGKTLNAPIVDMAARADGDGYWLAAMDGGIFAFNAPFYGNLAAQHVDDVVAITPTAPPTDPAGFGGAGFSPNEPTSFGPNSAQQRAIMTKAAKAFQASEAKRAKKS